MSPSWIAHPNCYGLCIWIYASSIHQFWKTTVSLEFKLRILTNWSSVLLRGKKLRSHTWSQGTKYGGIQSRHQNGSIGTSISINVYPVWIVAQMKRLQVEIRLFPSSRISPRRHCVDVQQVLKVFCLHNILHHAHSQCISSLSSLCVRKSIKLFVSRSPSLVKYVSLTGAWQTWVHLPPHGQEN